MKFDTIQNKYDRIIDQCFNSLKNVKGTDIEYKEALRNLYDKVSKELDHEQR